MMGLSAFSEVMRSAWDHSIGSDTLNSWEIRDAISARPDDDPISIIEQNLCDLRHARDILKEADETAEEVCVPVWNGSQTSSPDLRKRVFNANLRTHETTSNGSPRINTGALLNRILTTEDVPFLYSRITRYSNFQRAAPVGNQRIGTILRDENGQQLRTEQVNLEGECFDQEHNY
jgi:hypothetical protein